MMWAVAITYLAGNSAKYLKYSLYVLVQRSPKCALSCNFLCLSSLLMVSMTSFLGKLSWDYCWLEKEGTLDWRKFETKVGYRPCLSRNTYTVLYTPTTVACRVSHVISVLLSGQMFTHTSLREQIIEHLPHHFPCHITSSVLKFLVLYYQNKCLLSALSDSDQLLNA